MTNDQADDLLDAIEACMTKRDRIRHRLGVWTIARGIRDPEYAAAREALVAAFARAVTTAVAAGIENKAPV